MEPLSGWGVREREEGEGGGAAGYPPPQKSWLSTFPDGRFQCAPRVRTIGIKWLSGFIMMGELNFIERPGNSISAVIYRGVYIFFFFFKGGRETFRKRFSTNYSFFLMEAKKSKKLQRLISISKER